MTTIVINPGSGSIEPGRSENAFYNVRALACEAGHPDAKLGYRGKEDNGRWLWCIKSGEREALVAMPGWELERVRYTGAPGQNIWDFPRLYVDGGSWVWKFAVRALRDALDPRPCCSECGTLGCEHHPERLDDEA